MTIHEKLTRLTRFGSKSAICKEAGLGITTLTNLLARKSNVTIGTAMALARVLQVDAGWLMNDGAPWPPVRVESAQAVA